MIGTMNTPRDEQNAPVEVTHISSHGVWLLARKKSHREGGISRF